MTSERAVPRYADCTCPHAVQSLGRLHGVSMGRGTVRTSTTKGCPEHDACHGWTHERRVADKEKRPWGDPYCPIHATKNCPEGTPARRSVAPVPGVSADPR